MQTLYIIQLEEPGSLAQPLPPLPPSVELHTARDVLSLKNLLDSHQAAGVISPATVWGRDATELLTHLPGVAAYVLLSNAPGPTGGRGAAAVHDPQPDRGHGHCPQGSAGLERRRWRHFRAA